MAKSGHRTAVVERKLIGGPGPVTVSFRDLTTPSTTNGLEKPQRRVDLCRKLDF